MATHDYNLANQSGADFRADLNDVLQAVLTLNSSATEPTTTAAYMLWLDTANGVLKIRNGANDAWVILPLSISADNSVDIDGGTIDGISQLTLGSSTSVNSILDEDNLNSDSPTALATQQSIKAYVDSQVTAQDLDFQGDSGGVLSIDLDSEVLTLNGGTGIDTVGSENTMQFSIDSTVVTLVGVQVLTNKSIDADDNTITNLEVDNLKAGVLDTDLDAVSASDDTLASAKAIKTYVDANITAQDLDVSDGTTSIAIDLDSETLSLLGGTGVSSTASGDGVTFAIGQPVGTTDNVSFGVVTANLTGQVSDISNHSTSDLSEGTNLYYTTARFDTRLATKDTDDLSEGNNLYYTDARFDTRLATKDTDDLTEGLNLYYTQARFDSALTAKSTSDLSEGANLYYTNERVDDQVSALIQSGTGISWSYDDGAGTLTPTISLSPFSTTNLSEGTNLYYTTARFDSAFAGKDTGGLTEGSNLYYTSARFDSAFTGKSTSDLSEGTNLYYTTARWDSKLATADTDDLSEGTTNLYYTDTRANSAIDVRVNKAFVDALDVQAASVDANSVALGTDTTGNYVATIAGTNNQIEVSGSGSETAAVTVSLPNDVSVANNLTVAGNLTVNGTLTSLDTTNLAIEDNLFELNAGLTGTPVNDSGMLINRGNQDNGVFIWDESADKFTLGLTTADGTATGNITLSALGTLVADIEGNITGDVTGTVSDISNHNTGDLTEGSNLYYTDARSRAAISASGDISYNSSTGVISFTASAAPVTSVNTLTGAVVLTTANISENTNLYYTDARARAAISEGSTQLSYDSGTGVLTYTQGNTDTVAEGSTNLYYTQARFDSAFTAKDTDDLSEGAGNLYYTQARFNSAFTAKSTSDLSEGTNLYYTDARFDTRLATKDSDDVSEGTSNLYYTDTRANSAIDARVTKSFVDALNVVAASATGNAGTATTLATARTIGGTSFDGSADIAIALSSEATTLATARTIGGVSFDGSANIDLAGVNTAGNQDTSGNSATTTILATARTINGISFDGSANITTLTAGTGVIVSGTEVSIPQAVATSSSPSFAGLTLTGTGALQTPVGTTAQRPTAANGLFRYNSDDAQFEGYADGAWGAIAGGGGGSAMETNNFTGDGTTTAFTLSSSVSSEDNLIAFIEGVYQNKSDFVASGTTITFDTAPVSGRNIVVYHIRASISGSSVIQNAFTGDGSDTTFTLSTAPQSENNTQVHLNGVYQNKSTYTVSGTTLTFDAAPANGVAIEVIMFTQTTINEPAANTVGITQLDVSDGTNGQVLTTDGAGTLSFSTVSGTTINNNADNRIITGSATANTLEGEANFTFDTKAQITKTATGDETLLRLFQDSNTPSQEARITFARDCDAGTDRDVAHIAAIREGGNDTALGFFTDTTGSGSSAEEQMRIDAAGNLLVGTTSDALSGTDAGFVFKADGNASFVTGTGVMYMRRTTSDSVHIKFRSTANASVGQISSDGSNTTYSTSSDYRLKENVIYDWDATARLKQLKPARFNFLQGNTETQDGFLAHEVQSIVPTAVEGIKDAVDENGQVDPQSIDHSQLVPLLVKTIQELEARITTLENA